MTEPITCAYTFTPEEFRTSVLLSRRMMATWRKIIYIGMCLVFLTVAGLSLLGLRRADGTMDWGSLGPFAILVFVSVYLLSRILPIRALCSIGNFRKRPYCNRTIQNSISAEGIGTQTEHSAATLLWSGIGKARESEDGFAVFPTESRGIFVWFPFHGFASPADIERCRAVIQEHVKDFRRV
jgi:hypothetical protein